MIPTLHINPVLSERQRRQAALVYYQSFAGNFAPLSRSPRQVVRLLCRALNPERTVVVFAGDRVVAVAGMRFRGQQMLHFRLSHLARYLGWWQGLLSQTTTGYLLRSQEPDELLVDGLAVRESWRGRGIGKRLLTAIKEIACSEGLSVVRLEVEADNSAALGLYRKMGFREVFFWEQDPLPPEEKISMEWPVHPETYRELSPEKNRFPGRIHRR